MNQVLAFLLLTAMQLIAGFGLVTIFRIRLKPSLMLPLSILCGVGIFSLIPFLLQLFWIPLTDAAIIIALALITIVLNYKSKESATACWNQIKNFRYRFRLYDIPLTLLIVFVIFVSAWRCYYYPPFPRDLTSGPEVIAEYATIEKTMVNSVFTVNLESTNNQFKPPYITSLQIIYKYAGFAFGQVWLISIFICFVLFIYSVLSERLHRMLAGLLLIFFLAIPEMYAYTFMALFDYSNAVFFALSSYFLIRYFDAEHKPSLALAGFLMGFAVYIRSETLVLAFLMIPVILWYHIKKWDGLILMGNRVLVFLAPSVLLYLITVKLYLKFYLPVQYDVEGLVNRNLLNLKPLFQRFADMNSELIFSETGINYYGYFVFIFLLILLFDLIFIDHWNRNMRNWIYMILVVYLGLPLLGYLLPLMDLDHSTKRGLFKLFPLMVLYFSESGVLRDLSIRILNWEKS